MNKELLCADVAVPLPIQGLFTYEIPGESAERARPGVRVLVPFKNRELTGYLVDVHNKPPAGSLKPLIHILDDEPVISASMLSLTKWVGEYYGSSWGEAIENALPKWVKYGKKASRALAKEPAETVQETPGDAPLSDKPSGQEFVLSDDQSRAMRIITDRLKEREPRPVLLHGVTGSGKSEIYIRTIREILKKGQSAVCLVPEIALTEQLRLFFGGHFGNLLEVLHSKLSDGERFLTWKRLERGSKRVILGPRSAIFAPVSDLGLIVIDEEHEGSYKQETTPRYHAREVAVERARREGALLLMGSATPSLEIMSRCERGEIEKISLESRIERKALPTVQLIDLKDAVRDQRRQVVLSPRLISEIGTNLKKKEGVMLLLNRRGFSTRIQCPACGNTESCQSCRVSLTYHQEDDVLLCHYCNYRKKAGDICSFCRQPLLRFSGFGTEKVESEVARYFPSARVGRMDADSVRRKGAHEEILGRFRRREIEVLIGTQMIAKGFDFPHVTLVGVILADVGLSLPDFRSSERTFQLMTQVAGRAGRGDQPGRVVIQTFSPEHPSILYAQKHDYRNFYEYEKKQREQFFYPPSARLINVIIRAKDEKKAYQFARAVRDAVREVTAPGSSVCGGAPVEIVGPAPLPFYKLRGNFRWHVMIKYGGGPALSTAVSSVVQKLKKPSGVAYVLDVDPLNIL
jgi:primosomal protein N' (replication factor Y)